MSFTIKQGRFEGPYHKLLEMIEERKLSINEISLASIADDYVTYAKGLTDNKDDISQFILVAATLMLIKVKSLLPTIEYTVEEKEEVANLEYKLNLYKVLMDASREIKRVWIKRCFARARVKIYDVMFSPGNIKSITLQSVSILTMVKLPHLERLKSVAVAQAIKIEQMIEDILDHLRFTGSHLQLNFKSILDNVYERYRSIKDLNNFKTYKIVGFLAILDMVRNGIVEAEQADIDINVIIKSKNNVESGV